jgi:hypothetical protein
MSLAVSHSTTEFTTLATNPPILPHSAPPITRGAIPNRSPVMLHDSETLQAAKQRGLNAEMISFDYPGVTVENRLRATDEMIRETANVDLPGSSLPLWKVLAMDDFLSSLQLFGAWPTESLAADLIVDPLTHVSFSSARQAWRNTGCTGSPSI